MSQYSRTHVVNMNKSKRWQKICSLVSNNQIFSTIRGRRDEFCSSTTWCSKGRFLPLTANAPRLTNAEAGGWAEFQVYVIILTSFQLFDINNICYLYPGVSEQVLLPSVCSPQTGRVHLWGDAVQAWINTMLRFICSSICT